MTPAVKQLVDAIDELENTAYQFENAMRLIGPVDEPTETNVYVSITGSAWKCYLEAGGSRTMHNPQVPAHLDFNHNHRAELKA